VITCGLINGGYGFNIVADEVKIVGTTRTFSKEAQDIIKTRMGCICCGVAKTFGGEIDMEYECKYFSPIQCLFFKQTFSCGVTTFSWSYNLTSYSYFYIFCIRLLPRDRQRIP